MEELKKQAHKEFDEQATWEKFGRLTSDKQKIFVKSFIDSLIDKTVQMTEERIVWIIQQTRKRPNYLNPTMTESAEIISFEDMEYNKALQDIESLITNKSDINK